MGTAKALAGALVEYEIAIFIHNGNTDVAFFRACAEIKRYLLALLQFNLNAVGVDIGGVYFTVGGAAGTTGSTGIFDWQPAAASRNAIITMMILNCL